MLNIVVCEDNANYREFIVKTIQGACAEHGVTGAVVLSCDSPEVVLGALSQGDPNVFFLDIDLEAELNGIDLAALIHTEKPEAYIVFVSQYDNLVFKSFKVRPFDFLPKPVTAEDLSAVLLEIQHDYEKKIQSEQPDVLPVKIGSQFYQIPKSEILFLEKYGNKCIIHAVSKTVYCYQSLESLSVKLDAESFLRCHKSFIVNLKYIASIDLSEMQIRLTDGQLCYIGGKYKKELVQRLAAFDRA